MVERTLGIEDIEEVGQALGVKFIGQFDLLPVCLGLILQRTVADLFLGISHQRVLNVLQRCQQCLFIDGQRFFLLLILNTDVGADSARVEDAPLHCRASRPKLAATGEPIAGADALESRSARQRKLGKQLRGLHAYASGSGRKLAFGAADVGAAAEQL